MMFKSVTDLGITKDDVVNWALEQPVQVSPCVGCDHLIDNKCNVLADPTVQHTRLGGCHMRTHNRSMVIGEKGKGIFVDPLKASKKAMKSKIKESKKTATPSKKKERRDGR